MRFALASLQYCLPLTGVMNQVSRNEELLNTARDYFYFVTRFFEPISVSATHIYHTALELSPLSSIIRRFYHHQRHPPSPRVIAGNQDLWDQSIAVSCGYNYGPFTWSPCGRFIAAGNGECVEIRDPLSFELLSTLVPTGPTQGHEDQVAYSMDGRLVASVCDTSLTIWDIQTGGVAKTTEHRCSHNVSLEWSLNGSAIGIISKGPGTDLYNVYIYNVASGAMDSPGALLSEDEPYLWAHDTSFRIMTTAQSDKSFTVSILEVGSVLTEIESFHIGLWEWPFFFGRFSVGSFSQTTYRVSVSVDDDCIVLDARTSRRLLTGRYLRPDCFSSNGSLFAGISVSESVVRIWKYASDGYTSWRKFPLQDSTLDFYSLRFSPTSPPLLARSNKFLHLLRLDGPPIVDDPDYCTPLVAISRCGSYMATGRERGRIVTITNLLSQTPSHFIDTDMTIYALALTGNILLACSSKTIVAWRLTKEGAVDGVFVGGRADRNDGIWTVSLSGDPTFSVENQTVAIKQGTKVIHVYCTETGEVLESVQTPPHHCREYTVRDVLSGRCYLRHHRFGSLSWTVVQGGLWVKGPEGKYQLWIPVKWRNPIESALLTDDGKVLRFDSKGTGTILIKF